MQFGLFGDQESALAIEPKRKSYGKQVKEAYARDQQFQKIKEETQRLQRQWTNGAGGREAAQEQIRMEREIIKNAAPLTVTLVACVSLKLETAAPAAQLYISDWFKKACIYAENAGDRWFILSALYGLVEPEQTIEPYNFTLNGQRKAERDSWAQRIANDIRRRVPPKSRIIILAGENYRAGLMPLLKDDFSIEVPMVGLGIGQQLAFLKEANDQSGNVG